MAKKNNDELVSQLLKKVEEKKAQIEKIRNPDFKTNMSFPMEAFGSGNRVNLNVATPETLFSLLTYLDIMSEASGQTKELFGVVFPSKWYNFTLDEWKNDIVLKIKQNQMMTQVKELREIEGKLNSLMSEEKKTNIELEKLSNLLT